MLIYSALLTVALLVSSPWWLLRMVTTERYREGLRERLGLISMRLLNDPDFALKKVVWLHAVSVGEVLAATRLVSELETTLGEGWTIVVSTTTRTGQALARERFGRDRVFYMPLDFAWTIRRYLRVLRPAMLVLMESELWPRMLHECRVRDIPVAVVNARVSDRSFARGIKVRALWGRFLRMVPLWLTQSDEDSRRLIEMGANPTNVKTSGNLKYDIRAPKRSALAALIREAAEGRKIVIAGSTCGDDPPEDSPFIQWQQSIPRDQRPLLILAPRHPQVFDVVYSMAVEFPTLRATEVLAGSSEKDGFSVPQREGQRATVDIILLDTIGDLAALYALADVAFVGGSLVDRGGHNPLEPAQFSVPVIMGPHYANFRDIVNKMQAADGIRIVTDTVELRATLELLLKDRELAQAVGRRGQQVCEEQQGATARTVAALTALVRGERA